MTINHLWFYNFLKSMIEITCNNSVCRFVFKFHEDKNPNAKNVMCPKCKTIQPVPSLAVGGNDAADDWFRPKDKPPVAPSPLFDESKIPASNPSKDMDDDNDFLNEISNKPSARKQATPPPDITPATPDGNIGWLVVHDEKTSAHTFQLREGMNRIGRLKPTTPANVNIGIKTNDDFMSRYHCDLEVTWNRQAKRYDYVVSDKAYGSKSVSMNGTYVNAASRRLSPMDERHLKDGDTLQIGETKLILKTPSSARDARDAERKVKDLDYSKTVIF